MDSTRKLTDEEKMRYQQCPSLYDEAYEDAVRYASNGGRTEKYKTAWDDFKDTGTAVRLFPRMFTWGE